MDVRSRQVSAVCDLELRPGPVLCGRSRTAANETRTETGAGPVPKGFQDHRTRPIGLAARPPRLLPPGPICAGEHSYPPPPLPGCSRLVPRRLTLVSTSVGGDCYQHASPWDGRSFPPPPLLGRVRRGPPHFHPHTDVRKRHPTLGQTAGKQSFTRHRPARLHIAPCMCRWRCTVGQDSRRRCSRPRQRRK